MKRLFWRLFGWRCHKRPNMTLWIRCPGDDRVVLETLERAEFYDTLTGKRAYATFIVDTNAKPEEWVNRLGV